MFSKKELKEISHICAYCDKALTEKNKTIDHITPQCANGKGYANNIVEMFEQHLIKIDKIKQATARKISNKFTEPI